MVSFRSALVAMILVSGALGACSSSDSADQSDLSMEELLTGAAAAMTDVESAAFTIEQSGAEVFIDDADQLAFKAAEGRFAAPSSAEALVTVEALGFTTEVGAVAIDGTLWFTNPLSGEWTEAPESFTFDPAVLFDANQGLPALLTESTTTAELIDDTGAAENERIAGTFHVRTPVSAERVAVLTGGLVTEPTEADLWIDRESSRVVEARFDIPVDGTMSSWRMTISDYDADVVIEPPVVGATG